MQSLWADIRHHQRRKGVILALVLLLNLVLAGTHYGIIKPRLQRLERQLLQLQAEVKERRSEAARSGLPVSKVARIKQNMQQFRQWVPRQTDFPVFLGDLFNWAKQAGIEIDQISYQPELEPEVDILRYGLNFSVAGDYRQIKKFVHLLENSERILIINSLALAGKQNREEANRVGLNINLTTFFQGQLP